MSQGIGIVNHRETNIEELLKRTDIRYEVPFFQREYSWTKDDWTDFLLDLEHSRTDENGHFFGFMALQRHTEHIDIIEGQQRITTVSILVAVVRDLIIEKDLSGWQEIDRDFIKTADTLGDTSEIKYKLQLSEMNKSFFRDFVQQEGAGAKKIETQRVQKLNLSNKLIYDCYRYFHSELSAKTKSLPSNDQLKYFKKTVSIALRKFVIFSIDVADEFAAYNIFQTLNDRGLDLALADLLKVHLFKLFGSSSWQHAKERWDEIRNILSQIKLNTFLRHYWLSKYGVVQETALLREFQKKIRNAKEADHFIKEIKNEAETYEALMNPTKDFWEDDEIVDLLDDLKLLSVQMPLPLLMAATDVFQGDIKSVLRLLTSFIMRYVTIGQKDNKPLERLLSEIAVALREGKLSSASEIKEKLMGEYIDDDVFRQDFSTAEIKVAKVAKYILQKIENHVSPEQEKFNKKISVEHILPKTPDNEWEEYLKEQGMNGEEYVNRIGNMTLLLGRVNSRLKNDFIAKKRDLVYSKPEQTKLQLNSRLATAEGWNATDISNRQKWMATQATAIWRL